MADNEPSGRTEGLNWKEEARKKGLRISLKAEELLNRLGFLPPGDWDFIDEKDLRPFLEKKSGGVSSEVREEGEIRVLRDYTAKASGSVSDFVAHFRDRLKRLRKLFALRAERISAAKAKATDSFVGMLYEKRRTRKGDLVLHFEDEEDEILVFVKKQTKVFQEAQGLLEDAVYKVQGRMGSNFFSPKEILPPDLPVGKEPKVNPSPIAYLSDLHFGSRLANPEYLKAFTKFLREDPLGKEIGTVVVSGDVVDGIGIYRGQEKELLIRDIDKQYKAFEEFIGSFPDRVSVVVLPGNHDGVRRAEPQPSLKGFLEGGEILVSNPAFVEINGLVHLLYHGTSLDGIIASVPGLSYQSPHEAMSVLLKLRHLSPKFGDNLIAPASPDPFVIDLLPDVVHMGHVHTNGYKVYRGVYVINSGTFQERTEYQVKMGHHPTPGRVPVLVGNTVKEIRLAA